MDKDDINNNNNNNETALAVALPQDLWRNILDHIDPKSTDGKNFALVSKQLLQAWRSGVLGIRIWGCDLQDLNFLRTEFSNNRGTATSFPRLRTLELNEHRLRRSSLESMQSFPDGATPQDLTLRLRLTTSKLVLEVLELARSFPALAARVTHLQLGPSGRRPNKDGNTPLVTDYLAELIAAFPNLEELIVIGTPSLDRATHELLTQRSALKRLTLVNCQPISTGCLPQLTTICPQVDELTLEDCALHDEDVWPLIAHWPSLRGLRVISHRVHAPFAEHATLSDADIGKLLNSPLQLELLALVGNHKITPEKLIELGKAQPRLTHLILQGARYESKNLLGDEHLKALSAWPQLQCLDISGIKAISETGLQHLSQCVGLTELVLGTDIGITGDELVGNTPLFPNLLKLTVRQRPFDFFTGSGFQRLLANCPNITHFDGVALQSEEYDTALADFIASVQLRLQTTRATSGTPSLRTRLREFDVMERFLIVRALLAILKDATEPVEVNLDLSSSTSEDA